MTSEDVKGFVVNRQSLGFFMAIVAAAGVVWTAQGYVMGMQRDIEDLQQEQVQLQAALSSINSKLDQVLSRQQDLNLIIRELQVRRELENRP